MLHTADERDARVQRVRVHHVLEHRALGAVTTNDEAEVMVLTTQDRDDDGL